MSAKSEELSLAKRKDELKTIEGEGSSWRWLGFLGVVAIVVITLLVYMPAMRGDFIWDDDLYISENAVVKSPSGLGKIWPLRFVTKDDGQRVLVGNIPQYYPLLFTAFWLEARLWGWDNPTGFHVVNVLLHICSALLVWHICGRLRLPWAFMVGAIFALHPVAVESVAWITEQKNVLSGVFYMLALLWYLRFDETRRKRFYLAAGICFLLALLSKTVTCSLPVILLLILWLRHGRVSWADVVRLIPFFAFGAVLGLFTAYYERHHVGAAGVEWQIAFWQRCVIAGRGVFFYISKLVWPAKLTFIYPRWNPDEFSRLDLLWPGAVIGVTLVLWFGRRLIGRAPLVAWAAFIVTLFPALGFIDVYPFRYSFVADHFQYLASVFIIALFVGVAYSFYKGFCVGRFKFLVWPGGKLVLTSIVLLSLAYLTYGQTGTYENVETLWSKTIENNPGAWMAYNNRGIVYSNQGKLELAISDGNKSLELNPKNAKAYYNRGMVLGRIGRHKAAILDFTKAIELDPTNDQAYNNRGINYQETGEYDLAIGDLAKTLELNPNSTIAHINLSIILGRQGRAKEAIGHARDALRLQPDWPKAINGLAWILATYEVKEFRDGTEAVRLARRACELTNYLAPMMLDTLGAAYADTGQFERAIATAQRAVQLAQQAHDVALANRIRARMALYKSKRAYREPMTGSQ